MESSALRMLPSVPTFSAPIWVSQNNATCLNTRGSYRFEYCIISNIKYTFSLLLTVASVLQVLLVNIVQDHQQTVWHLQLSNCVGTEPASKQLTRVFGTHAFVNRDGKQMHGVTVACTVDVDECADLKPHCSMDPEVRCINLPGSYIHVAHVGYARSWIYRERLLLH